MFSSFPFFPLHSFLVEFSRDDMHQFSVEVGFCLSCDCEHWYPLSWATTFGSQSRPDCATGSHLGGGVTVKMDGDCGGGFAHYHSRRWAFGWSINVGFMLLNFSWGAGTILTWRCEQRDGFRKYLLEEVCKMCVVTVL